MGREAYAPSWVAGYVQEKQLPPKGRGTSTALWATVTPASLCLSAATLSHTVQVRR
jgi:hypothetical protein